MVPDMLTSCACSIGLRTELGSPGHVWEVNEMIVGPLSLKSGRVLEDGGGDAT